MGYLDNDTIVVDAILTKHGRKLLSEGQAINPEWFALSDDGIDYTLWNTNSPSGSTGYDDYITKLPMIEAVPSDEVMMRYTLWSGDQNLRYMPTVEIENCPTPACIFTLSNKTVGADSITITPGVVNYTDNNPVFTFRLSNYTGIDVRTDGQGPYNMTGHGAKPYEQKAPITVEFTGCTYISATDLTVTQDVRIGVRVIHEATGFGTDATILVQQA